MSVEKTYSLTVKYEKSTAGLKTSGAEQGSTKTISALTESDHEYTELRKIILKRIAETVPVSQGVVSAHIVGEVSES